MDPDERRLLARARRAYLATADADGRPAAVPVCFALVDAPGDGASASSPASGRSSGDDIVTPVDEKPKAAEPDQLRRVRDVAANPRVALTVDRYEEDWSRLAWVQVRGTARVVRPGEPGHGASVATLRRKYDQYARHALEGRPVIRIEPGHAVSWGDLAGERDG